MAMGIQSGGKQKTSQPVVNVTPANSPTACIMPKEVDQPCCSPRC